MAESIKQPNIGNERPTGNDHQGNLLTERASPLILIILVICSVLLSEIIAFFLINIRNFPSTMAAAMMDALTTTVFVFPAVYFLVFKRMQTQVRQLQELEKSLRQSEADYRGIVEDQTELICRINLQGKISFINGAFSKYTGDPAERILGKDYLFWFIPEDVTVIKDQISRLTPNHPIETGEYRQMTSGGDIRWFSWTIRAIYNQAGELIHYQLVGRETTDYRRAMEALQDARDGLELKVQQRTLEMVRINRELRDEILTRKNAENALKTSEFHLQQLVGQIPAILWTMDKELCLTSLQGSRIAELQSQFKQLLEFNLKQSTASGDNGKPEIKAHLEALQGNGASFELYLWDHYYHCTVEPFRDPDGAVVGCLGIALDITSRKHDEDLIRMQSTALEAAADGIMITDPDGIIQWGNPALAELTGYPLAELIGRTPALFNSGTHPEAFFTTLWNTILSGGVWRGETYNRRKDATEYVEEQTINPVWDEDGHISNFIAIKHDITARKSAEEQIARRNWELQALNSVANSITPSLDINLRLAVMKQWLAQEMSIPSGAVFSYDPDPDRFRLETAWGSPVNNSEAFVLTPIDHARVLQEKKPFLVTPAQIGQLDILSIPLLSQGEVQGVIDLSIQGSKIGAGDRFDFFESLGHQIGVAIHNARLYKAEKQARQTAEVLRDASLALSQTLDLNTVIRTLLDSVAHLVPNAERISVFTLEEGSLQATAIGGIGPAINLEPPELLDVRDYPLLWEVVESHTARLVEDTSGDPLWRPVLSRSTTRCWLGVPIRVAGEIKGICCLESDRPGCFTQYHIGITEALLGEAAVAIQNALLYEEIHSGRERLQALSRRLVEVQEVERRYISRKLHDDTSQALIGLVFALEIIKRDAGNPEAVASGFVELERIIGEILGNLHHLAVDLRPTALDHLGLIPAVRQYIDGISEKHSLPIHLDVPQLTNRLPGDIETALYRIIQEALANVIRHAKATQANVRIELREGQVRAFVSDDGCGFNVDEALASERLGLFGMRERAEMLGGSLTIISEPGRGARISMEIPYDISNIDRG
jgi:PAS domain S-box-containing protein